MSIAEPDDRDCWVSRREAVMEIFLPPSWSTPFKRENAMVLPSANCTVPSAEKCADRSVWPAVATLFSTSSGLGPWETVHAVNVSIRAKPPEMQRRMECERIGEQCAPGSRLLPVLLTIFRLPRLRQRSRLQIHRIHPFLLLSHHHPILPRTRHLSPPDSSAYEKRHSQR